MATRPPFDHPTRSPDGDAAHPPSAPVTSTPRSRTGATWVGIAVAAILLVVLIVFMLQNTQPVVISFFTLEGTVPLALALLIAGVGVALVALTVGSLRIGQLRRRLTRERRQH